MERQPGKKIQHLSLGLFSGLALIWVITSLLPLVTRTSNAWSDFGGVNNQTGQSQFLTTPTPPLTGQSIAFLEGFEVKAGDVVNVSLSGHAMGDYDLYFAEQYIGTLSVDASGVGLFPSYTTPPLAPGFYTLKSPLSGQTIPYAAATVQVVLMTINEYCAPLIQNGKFEDTELMSLWHYSSISEQVTLTSVPHWLAPGESFSMLLPDTTVSGLPRSPWLYQEFTLPSWVLTPTLSEGSRLTLTLHVGVNPEGSPEPDPLFVSLLNQSGSLTIVSPITLATGADTPTINPFQPNNDDWLFKSINLADYFNPAEYKNQILRLYFYAPNPAGTNSTRFYLDNVDLILCTIKEALQRSIVIEAPQSTATLAGQVVIYTHTITNTSPGILPEVFSISATASMWESTWQPLTVTLAPGEAAPVTVTLAIPGDAPDYALNVLSITVASQVAPNTVRDLLIDTTTIDPQPEIVNNAITPAGIVTQVVTITTGSSVVWTNQTTTTQALFSCYLLYFPLILKHNSEAEPSPLHIKDQLSLPNTIWPVPVSLAPGQAYTHTFTTAGQFNYCLASFPEVTNTVVVLGGPSSDFRVAINPTSQSVMTGESATYGLHLNALYGFTNPVTLAATGMPTDTTAHFSQNPISPTAKAKLTVSPATTTPAGTYSLYIEVKGSDISHTLPASLTIMAGEQPDFALGLTPATQTVTRGSSLTYTLHLTPLNGFSDPVTLAVTAAPTGTFSQIAPDLLTPPGSSVLTITTTPTTALGLHSLTVQGQAGLIRHTTTASLAVTSTMKLDVVLVLDRSGSMELDPVCYGCWERTETAAAHETDIPRWAGYYTYPSNGVIYPIGFNDGDDTNGGFSHPRIAEICEPNPIPAEAVYRVPGQPNVYYMIMEAELYSRNPAPVSTEFRESGKGYWALQRGEGNYDDPTNPYLPSTGFSIDARGAHMAHHPSSTFYPPPDQPLGHHYTLAEAQNMEAPVLVYDFKFRNGGSGPNLIDWTGDPVYIWVRVHGGRGVEVDGNQFQFPLYGDDADGNQSTVEGTNAYWAWTADLNGDGIFNDAFSPVADIPPFTLQSGIGWRWVRLNASSPITADADPNATYQFYFYAGSSGFSLDQIVVTNDANPTLPVEVQNQTGGSLATKGSASRSACDPCNVIYGENIGAIGSGTPYELDDCNFLNYTQPVNHSQDPLFGEWESPLRAIKESLKHSINLFDPEQDQVGLVPFNGVDGYPNRTELECLKRYGAEACAGGTNPFSYTQVFKDIEDIHAGGTTNTGAGMKAGLEILGVDVYDEGALGTTCNGSTCARRDEAQQIMILLTDGVPNANPGGACTTQGPPWTGTIQPDSTADDYECPLYFAQQAAQNGVIVYVIGFSYGVDGEFLQQIAELGQGGYYFAASGSDLEIIFYDIQTFLSNRCDLLPIVLSQSLLAGISKGELMADIPQGSGSGNFDWLRWRESVSTLGITTSSITYLIAEIDNPWLVDADYINPIDPSDTILNANDWVWAFTGEVNTAELQSTLEKYLGRAVLLPVWDTLADSGQNRQYHMGGFINFYLAEANLLSNPPTISGAFLGWDTTCRPNN